MKPVMYHGERVSWSGKVYQCFKDRKGKEHWFGGIKGVWFGSVYEMEPGDKMKVKPKEAKAKWEPTDKESAEYEAQKIVVKAHRMNKRKAMAIQRPHKDILRAAELMAPFYRALSDMDRRRFMEWFSNELSKRRKK